MPLDELDSLITPDEQRDLDRLLQGAGSEARAGDDGLADEVARLYVEARVSGLCREGALELAKDALRSHAR